MRSEERMDGKRQNVQMVISQARWLILISPGFFLLLIFFLFPMVKLLHMSFMKYDRITLYQAVITWENYGKFFGDPYFIEMIFNSLKVGFYTTLFSLLIGYPLAYYLTRIRGIERTILTAACMLPIFVTILVTTLGWYIILLPFGIVQNLLLYLGLHQGPLRWMQSMPALIAVLVHLHIPFVVLMLVASIQNVSQEKVDAAKILGASTFRVFQKVVIPLTVPGIVSSAILVFAESISSYLVPVLITGEKISLLPLSIFSYTSELMNWPFASAIAILLLVIVLIVTYAVIMLTNRMTCRGKWEMV
jgi:ABC-type spermidine/putrescine transport system permease subunit I